jgi:hypothetical protein
MADGRRRDEETRERPKPQHEGNRVDRSTQIPRPTSEMDPVGFLDPSTSGVDTQLRLLRGPTHALPCAESAFATSFSPAPPRPRRTSAAPIRLGVTLRTCALHFTRVRSQFATPHNTHSITHSLSWVTSTTSNLWPCERRGTQPVR